MTLRINKRPLFDDAGNGELEFKSITNSSFAFAEMQLQIDQGEVLVGLFWPEPGSNEEKNVALIETQEDFDEFMEMSKQPRFLYCNFAALSRADAEKAMQ